MGSDPQSYLQAMHELEHRECKKRIAELEAAACEARTSLGAAIAQSLDTDCQTMMNRVREAYAALGGKL